MLTQISSADNAKVKLIRKLRARKDRDGLQRFTAEGINLVSQLLADDYDGFEIDFIAVSSDFRQPEDDERYELIRRAVVSEDLTVCEIDESIFSGLTDAQHGVDVLAVVKAEKRSLDLLDTLPDKSNILICDRIQDPGNMGTMIRTAVASGYAAVLATPGTVDVYSPKVLRATAGLIFNMPTLYAPSTEALISKVHESGRRIVVSVPDGGSEYYNADLKSNVALVVGNEGAGVSDELSEAADIGVTLPMKGNIESLNAAVAAAILMYEAVRT